MWLPANLHPKLLLPGEGRGADRHFWQLGSSWAPRLLTQTLSQTRTPLPWTQRSQIKAETRDGGLCCGVKVQNPPSLTAPLLTPALSIPSLLGWARWFVFIHRGSTRERGLWSPTFALPRQGTGNWDATHYGPLCQLWWETPSSASRHNGQLQLLQTRRMLCPAAAVASYKRPLKFPDFLCMKYLHNEIVLRTTQMPPRSLQKIQLVRRNKKYAREREIQPAPGIESFHR